MSKLDEVYANWLDLGIKYKELEGENKALKEENKWLRSLVESHINIKNQAE